MLENVLIIQRCFSYCWVALTINAFSALHTTPPANNLEMHKKLEKDTTFGQVLFGCKWSDSLSSRKSQHKISSRRVFWFICKWYSLSLRKTNSNIASASTSSVAFQDGECSNSKMLRWLKQVWGEAPRAVWVRAKAGVYLCFLLLLCLGNPIPITTSMA